jgi:hypothetical protein
MRAATAVTPVNFIVIGLEDFGIGGLLKIGERSRSFGRVSKYRKIDEHEYKRVTVSLPLGWRKGIWTGSTERDIYERWKLADGFSVF